MERGLGSNFNVDESLCKSDILPMHVYAEIAERQVSGFLSIRSIDTSYVKTLSVDERCQYLIDVLLTNDIGGSREIYKNDSDNITVADDIGMLLVKPEIMPAEGKVVSYMQDKGFDIKVLDRVYPSHNEWMSIYGYMLDGYPDAINLYIVQRSLGFRPILFRHLDTNRYLALLEGKGGGVANNLIDSDGLFDKLFCGNANETSPDTIRGDISYPVMKSLGFDDMTGYASSFDPVNYFKDTFMSKNYHAYNGVHIPSNYEERESNINTILSVEGGFV